MSLQGSWKNKLPSAFGKQWPALLICRCLNSKIPRVLSLTLRWDSTLSSQLCLECHTGKSEFWPTRSFGPFRKHACFGQQNAIKAAPNYQELSQINTQLARQWRCQRWRGKKPHTHLKKSYCLHLLLTVSYYRITYLHSNCWELNPLLLTQYMIKREHEQISIMWNSVTEVSKNHE